MTAWARKAVIPKEQDAAKQEQNALRVKRMFPIPQLALLALSKLGSATRIDERDKLISQIVAGAFRNDGMPMRRALEYTEERLLSGVSVSSKDTRFNFTLALAALCQYHAMTIEQLTELAATAARMYCDEGKDSKSDWIPRERALGALATASALSLAASPNSNNTADGANKREKRLLTTAMARDTLRIARVALEPSAKGWSLQPCTAKIIAQVFKNAKSPDNLVSPIWNFCADHPASEFAVSTALSLLLDIRIVSAKAVQSLIPALEGDFSHALFSVFGSFQSMFHRTPIGTQLKTDKDGGDAVEHDTKQHISIIPDIWHLAIRYVTAGRDICPTKEMNLINLWSVLVRDNLLKQATQSESREKRVFILQLLPIITSHLESEADFNHVFSSHLLSFVVSIVPHVQRRLADGPRQILVELKKSFSQIHQILSTNASTAKKGSDKKKFVRLFWVWALRGAPMLDMLADSTRESSFQMLSDYDIALLLRSAFDTIAHPSIADSSSEQSRNLASIIRMNTIKSFGIVTSLCPKVTHDVVRAMTMLCLFKPKDSDAGKKSTKITPPQLKWDIYKPRETDQFAGCLSAPKGFASSSVIFKYVINHFLISRKADNKESTTKTCVSVIKSCMQTKKNKPSNVAPCIDFDDARKSLYTRIVDAVTLIDAARKEHPTDNDEWMAVSEALREISMLLIIELFSIFVKTSPTDEDDDEDTQDIDELEELTSVVERVEDCCKALKDESSMSNDKVKDKLDNEGEDMDVTSEKGNDETEKVKAELIEKVTHLISDIGGRESLNIHSLTTRFIDCFSSFVDQRVVAVLIDAMETYTNEVERLGDTIVSDDEDEEGSEEEESEEQEEASGDEDEDNESIDKDVDNDKTMKKPKDDLLDDGDESSEGDVDLMNMDVDDEDPEALKQLDKHLSMHMTLLNKEKKKKRMLQRKGKGGAWRVKRVMGLVEHTLLAIRLRIERKDEVVEGRGAGSTDAVSLLGIMIRLFEFALGEDGGGDSGYLSAVCHVVSKQICSVNMQSLVSRLKQGIDADEDVLLFLKSLMEEFFNIIQASPFQFPFIPDGNVQVLNRAAGLLIDTCCELSVIIRSSLSRRDEMSFPALFSSYDVIVSTMLGSRKDVSRNGTAENKKGDDTNKNSDLKLHKVKWGPAIIQSFVRRSGDFGLKLIETVDGVFKEWRELQAKKSEAKNSKNKTRAGKLVLSLRERKAAAQIILLLARQAADLTKEIENADKYDSDKRTNAMKACGRIVTRKAVEAFWCRLAEFVRSFIIEDPTNFKRDSESVLKLARAVGLGLRVDTFKAKHRESLVSGNQLSNAIKRFPCFSAGPSHKDLCKRVDELLNAEKDLDKDDGADPDADNETGPDAEIEAEGSGPTPVAKGKRRRNRQSRSQKKRARTV